MNSLQNMIKKQIEKVVLGDSDTNGSIFSTTSKAYDRIKEAVDNVKIPFWYSSYVFLNYFVIFLSLLYVSGSLYLIWTKGIDDEQSQKFHKTGEIIMTNLVIILIVFTFLTLSNIIPSFLNFVKIIF